MIAGDQRFQEYLSVRLPDPSAPIHRAGLPDPDAAVLTNRAMDLQLLPGRALGANRIATDLFERQSVESATSYVTNRRFFSRSKARFWRLVFQLR